MQAMFDTHDVVAVACAIYREAGNKVLRETDESLVDRTLASKIRMYDHFSGTKTVTVTEQDRTAADDAITYAQQRLLMNAISGKDVSSFTADIVKLTEANKIDARQFGRIVWLPKIAEQMTQADKTKNEISLYALSSMYVGKVGSKVTLTFTPISKKFNREYNCYRYLGVDEFNNLVTFFNKNDDIKGTVHAKVKHQEVSGFYGGKVTALNYVKESKNGS